MTTGVPAAHGSSRSPLRFVDRLPRGLGALTVAKTVLSSAQRWVSIFLPVLSRAFGLSTGAMTSIMGLGQLGGLSTSVTGHRINASNERSFVIGGLAIAAASSVIALIGTPLAFGASFVLLVVGHTHATVAVHAWLGHRVPFVNRSRSIGVFETSWAFGLLIGAPILAGIIAAFGWRAAYVALAVAALASAWLVHVRVADDREPPTGSEPQEPARQRLGWSAWPPMLASATAALGGLGVFALASTWLTEAHGATTTQLGLIAAGYGCTELIASTSVATLTDRVGPKVAVISGLGILLVSVAIVWFLGDSFTWSVIGLLGFLGGFEFGYVSSLTLVSEAAPFARGQAIGTSNALSTIAKALGIAIAGQLYSHVGFRGPLMMAVSASVVASGWVLGTRLPAASNG